MKSSLNVRLYEITDQLKKDGHVDAKELAHKYGVSMETIRKDLLTLEEMGIAQKEYGGASLSILNVEKGLDFRIENSEKKTEIAKYVYSILDEYKTIILDAGSTCLRCVNYINKLENKNVFTNSILAFEQLDGNRNNVFLTGGRKRDKNQAIVGNWAEKFMKSIHADICLLGSAGLSKANGPTSHSYQELNLKQIMIENSDMVYVLVDSSKFSETSLHTICDWDKIDGVITDHFISQKNYDEFSKKVDIIIGKEN